MTTTRFKKKATGLIAVFFAVAGLCLSPLNVLAADVGTPDEETYYSIVVPDGNVSQESVENNLFMLLNLSKWITFTLLKSA